MDKKKSLMALLGIGFVLKGLTDTKNGMNLII